MRFRVLSLVAPFTALLASSCGGSARDATEKQLVELQAEISRLKADQAVLAERFDNAERARGAPQRGALNLTRTSDDRATPSSGDDAARAPDGDRPGLEVVRLSPGVDPDDPDADTPRPVLRVVGSGGDLQEPGLKKNRFAKPGSTRRTP